MLLCLESSQRTILDRVHFLFILSSSPSLFCLHLLAFFVLPRKIHNELKLTQLPLANSASYKVLVEQYSTGCSRVKFSSGRRGHQLTIHCSSGQI